MQRSCVTINDFALWEQILGPLDFSIRLSRTLGNRDIFWVHKLVFIIL